MPEVTACLSSDNPELLSAALLAIAEIESDSESVGTQIEQLLVHEDPTVRQAAATAYGVVGSLVRMIALANRMIDQNNYHMTKLLVGALRANGDDSDETYAVLLRAFLHWMGDYEMGKETSEAIRIIDPHATISEHTRQITDSMVDRDIFLRVVLQGR